LPGIHFQEEYVMKTHRRARQLFSWLCAAAVVGFLSCAAGQAVNFQATADDAGAKKAFAEAAEVLFHPRCQNCHPAGDAPTVGNDRRPHLFNVKRGPEGKGIAPLNCTLCHRETNPPGGPPGVPNWHMPPENMPMVFQGRTPGELCRQLKDPKQNGGKTGDQVIEHIAKDPLVLWGWSPGGERTVPKMNHKDFAAKMNEWVKKGGACPE
jgi:mono/diheme cytochrome c family protein